MAQRALAADLGNVGVARKDVARRKVHVRPQGRVRSAAPAACRTATRAGGLGRTAPDLAARASMAAHPITKEGVTAPVHALAASRSPQVTETFWALAVPPAKAAGARVARVRATPAPADMQDPNGRGCKGLFSALRVAKAHPIGPRAAREAAPSVAGATRVPIPTKASAWPLIPQATASDRGGIRPNRWRRSLPVGGAAS